MGNLVETAAEAEAVVRELNGQRIILDFETKGLDPWSPESYIIGAAVKRYGGTARYLSFRHPDSPNLPTTVLHDLWTHASAIDNHNRRFDVKMAHATEGLPLVPGRDSMTHMTLDNENHLGPTGTRKGAYQLKYRARMRFGEEAVAAETALVRTMLDRGLDPKGDLWQVKANEVADYACDDVNLVDRCFTEWLDPRIAQLGIAALAEEYDAYDALLVRMEVDGMQLDRALVEQYLDETKIEEPKQRQAIQERAATEMGWEPAKINPGSPVQMRTWLELPSTEAWRLRSSADPRAKMLLAWRRWAKARGTYYEPYLTFSDRQGVLRPSFWYTRTGRLTCFNPNLHATPHYGPEYKMKDCFVAPPGFFLAYADWSQAEMRLCAHYTRDPNLMEWFASGKDIHSMVAETLGLARQNAKPLNYGSAYGMGAAKMAREYGLTEKDAKQWLAMYHERIRGPRALYRRMGSIAETKWWIRSYDGRYRRFSLNPAVRAFPHSASNSLLQGGVGAMARRAMLRMQDWCYGNGGRMWIQIHDAIIFCLPVALDTPETFRYIRSVMEDQPFRVRMAVDLGKGRTWREASENKIKGDV